MRSTEGPKLESCLNMLKREHETFDSRDHCSILETSNAVIKLSREFPKQLSDAGNATKQNKTMKVQLTSKNANHNHSN